MIDSMLSHTVPTDSIRSIFGAVPSVLQYKKDLGIPLAKGVWYWVKGIRERMGERQREKMRGKRGLGDSQV